MVNGLEEKRIIYALSNKNIDKEKLKQISELSNLNEVYGNALRKILSDISKKSSILMNSEIELRNMKEEKAADILLNVRKKLAESESHIRNAINTLL